MNFPLGVVRTDGGLYRHVIEWTDQKDRSVPKGTPKPRILVCRRESLKDDALHRQWQRLRAVTGVDPEVVEPLKNLLRETVPQELHCVNVAGLDRWGRGEETDLTKWLCDVKGLRFILGHYRLESWAQKTGVYRTFSIWGDGLPVDPEFRDLVLPLIPMVGMDEMIRIVRCFETLRENPQALYRWLSLLGLGGIHSRAWASLITDLPQPYRTPFLDMILMKKMHELPVPFGLRRYLRVIDWLYSYDKVLELYTTSLDQIRKGGQPGFLFAGIQLSLNFGHPVDFTGVERGRSFPWKKMRMLVLTRLSGRDRDQLGRDLLRLWRACSICPGMESILTDLSTSTWEAGRFATYFDLMTNGFIRSRGRFGRSLELKIREFLRYRNEIRRCIEKADADYLDKVEICLSELLFRLPPGFPLECIASVGFELIDRLCRSPFSESSRGFYIFLRMLIYAGRDLYVRVRDLPDSFFKEVEKVSRNYDNQDQLGYGMVRMMKRLSAVFVVGCAEYSPGRLCQVARGIGEMDFEYSKKLLLRFSHHPLIEHDIEGAPIHETVLLLESIGIGRETRSVPEKLRNHFARRIRLSAPRLRHYAREMHRGAYQLGLEIVEGEAKEFVYAIHEVRRDRVDLHTLQLLQNVSVNRRKLRRFIRSIDVGEDSFVYDHPRSRAWLKSMPSLNEQLWLKGVKLPYRHEEVGELILSFELNPQEILKMGSYVESCLAIAGCNNFSAVSNLLDVNKQVIFARDPRGKFMARQLVAVSDECELVCFEVYSAGNRNVYEDVFRRYDKELASRLGIPLCRNEDYEISRVVSDDWYDDGALGWPQEVNDS